MKDTDSHVAQPKAPVIVPQISQDTQPKSSVVNGPKVLQLDTSDGTIPRQTLSDGSKIEVAANSRVEVLNYEDNSQAPGDPHPQRRHDLRDRARQGARADPLGVRRCAGVGRETEGGRFQDAAARRAIQGNTTVAPNSASKIVMNVSLLQGEAVIREVSGEQLVAAGETVTVGGQSDAGAQVAENWRSGQLVPKMEDGRAARRCRFTGTP